MPSITRTYPAAWAARMIPAVNAKIEQLQRHRVVQKIMGLRGFPSLAEMTDAQKAETLIDFMFWEITGDFEAAQARDAAYHAALETSIDDFTLEEP
jgi:hypothetical protein